jgi:methionine-R-sulfoxide reductase
MKKIGYFIVLIQVTSVACAQTHSEVMKENYRNLTPAEARVILHKGTEAPFTGKYNDFYESGTYVCKRCGEPLYRSNDKFNSHCGWPSFDDEIEGKVKHLPDPDGRRTEITCASCGAHLGHVFAGEGFTPKNVRHCVNSISLDFIPDSTGVEK